MEWRVESRQDEKGRETCAAIGTQDGVVVERIPAGWVEQDGTVHYAPLEGGPNEGAATIDLARKALRDQGASMAAAVRAAEREATLESVRAKLTDDELKKLRLAPEDG